MTEPNPQPLSERLHLKADHLTSSCACGACQRDADLLIAAADELDRLALLVSTPQPEPAAGDIAVVLPRATADRIASTWTDDTTTDQTAVAFACRHALLGEVWTVERPGAAAEEAPPEARREMRDERTIVGDSVASEPNSWERAGWKVGDTFTVQGWPDGCRPDRPGECDCEGGVTHGKVYTVESIDDAGLRIGFIDDDGDEHGIGVQYVDRAPAAAPPEPARPEWVKLAESLSGIGDVVPVTSWEGATPIVAARDCTWRIGDGEWVPASPPTPEPAPKFAVGDRVRAVRSGRVGAISDYDSEDGTYKVDLDDGGRWIWVADHLLEPEPPVAAPVDEPAPGDERYARAAAAPAPSPDRPHPPGNMPGLAGLRGPAPVSPDPGDDGTQAVIAAVKAWAEVESDSPPSILVAAGRYPSKTAAKRGEKVRRRQVARRLLSALAAYESGRAALGETR